MSNTFKISCTQWTHLHDMLSAMIPLTSGPAPVPNMAMVLKQAMGKPRESAR
jgi:hypothetical protein